MRKIMVLYLLIVAFLLTSSFVFAVDGYKDLAFGTSKEQILKNSGYSMIKGSIEQSGVEFYSCNNFKFGNQVVEAGAFFIDEKFLRFVIVVPLDQLTGIIDGLGNKYGQASSASPKAALEAFDSRQPNTEAFIAFDTNTVYLKISVDESGIQSAILMYTSPEYDKSLLKLQQSEFGGDL